MLTLALDTSTRLGSVALGRIDGEATHLLGEESLEVSATHSETVLPAIDRLLSASPWSAADLDAVVVGSGPGSFTGVRIAAALARGLCFPDRARLYAFSSLAAIASGSGAAGRVCAMLDARRGQVYAAGYEVGADAFAERFAPRAGALRDVLAELDAGEWLFAAALGEDAARAVEAAGGAMLAPEAGRPRASALLRLVAIAPEAGRIADPARWEPEYVRGSSAERRVGGG